jgi:hypothetical protein
MPRLLRLIALFSAAAALPVHADDFCESGTHVTDPNPNGSECYHEFDLDTPDNAHITPPDDGTPQIGLPIGYVGPSHPIRDLHLVEHNGDRITVHVCGLKKLLTQDFAGSSHVTFAEIAYAWEARPHAPAPADGHVLQLTIARSPILGYQLLADWRWTSTPKWSLIDGFAPEEVYKHETEFVGMLDELCVRGASPTPVQIILDESHQAVSVQIENRYGLQAQRFGVFENWPRGEALIPYRLRSTILEADGISPGTLALKWSDFVPWPQSQPQSQ